jgi:hypothetical protein
MSLPQLLTTATFDADTLAAEIGDHWLQGRTAYGGASAAIALAAAKAALADLPPLRSAQIAFVGPLSGRVTATPQLLRRGKSSAFVAVDVVGDTGIGLRALFLFMNPRESAIAHDDLPMPPIAKPAAEMDPDKVPQGFLRNFHLMPWQRGNGSLHAWRRLRERDGLDAEIELVVIADALPPAAMSLIDGWGPISSTTWQLNVIDAGPPADGWFLLESVAGQAADGASTQNMVVWGSDGRAKATATQSVALFV